MADHRWVWLALNAAITVALSAWILDAVNAGRWGWTLVAAGFLAVELGRVLPRRLQLLHTCCRGGR